MEPKNSSPDVIQGAHRFISKVIQGETSGPTNAVLIDIFREFLPGHVKDYVFTRMGKPILLELALTILQDLISNGKVLDIYIILIKIKTYVTSHG